jgi:ABC-type multidrug transport system fused ATPase/permease subunit
MLFQLMNDVPVTIDDLSVVPPDVRLMRSNARRHLSLTRPEVIFTVDDRICGGFELKTSIKFKKVSFFYPGSRNAPALSDVSFELPAQKVTGITGRTGSGKSTIAKLLKMAYDPCGVHIPHGDQPDCGIFLDGIPIKCFQTKYLRSIVALVQQSPVIFPRLTYAQNIALFRPVSYQQVVCAATDAGLPCSLSDLNSCVGRRLSPGEAQRLEIARALVGSPSVVILDEATSRLDPAAEHVLIEGLLRLKRMKKTVVVIAHQLHTIQSADHFVVMHKSRVAREGPFSDPVRLLTRVVSAEDCNDCHGESEEPNRDDKSNEKMEAAILSRLTHGPCTVDLLASFVLSPAIEFPE